METDLQSRGSWTSASGAERDALCPASFLRSQGQPEQPSEYAESGTRVHDWLAGKDVILTTAEEDVAAAALEVESRMLAEHLGVMAVGMELVEVKTTPGIEFYREKRFWLHWERQSCMDGIRVPIGQLSHSGQLDLLVVAGNRGFLSERKSLWGDIEESPKNLQVRDQVVLAVANIPGLTEVVCIVNQPRISRRPTPVIYRMDDIAQALEDLQKRVEASHDPDAKAVPGLVQCRFCRARRVCPEFLTAGLPISVRFEPPLPSEAAIRGTLSLLDSEKLGAGLGMARLLAQAFEDETRARLGSGIPVDGWHLAPGRVTEAIVDPEAVFARFVAAGGDQASFMRAVKLVKGRLKDALREATGSRGELLALQLERLIEGATESKTSAEILERK
jgi:hypothetical protein